MEEQYWLERVQKYGGNLRGAPDHIRDNFDIAMAAVRHVGSSLQYTSPRLRDDPDIVLAAVKDDGWALKYASERLRDDPDIVTAAIIDSNGYALEFASDRLQNDPELVLAAVGDIIKYDPDSDSVPREWFVVAVRHGFVIKDPNHEYYEYSQTCQTLVLLMKKDVLCKDVVKRIKELM